MGEDRAQFLHQVEREAHPAGPVGVQEADLRVEAVGLERRAAIVAEHRVEEEQDRIDTVDGRPPRAPAEAEGLALDTQHGVEADEIDERRLVFEPAQGVDVGGRKRAARDVEQAPLGRRERLRLRRRQLGFSNTGYASGGENLPCRGP